MQKEYNNQSDYINTQFMAPPDREGAFFFKNTLHFHQKVIQKHTKIKIQSLEQGLPGTALEGSLTEQFWTSTTSG